MREAKDTVLEWGKGASFDNGRELQITKYYGKPNDVFSHGPLMKEGERGVCECEWLRYAIFEIRAKNTLINEDERRSL